MFYIYNACVILGLIIIFLCKCKDFLIQYLRKITQNVQKMYNNNNRLKKTSTSST